ncbi:MAG: AzlD domain-containing protein [Bacillota bacterium]|nr:AzlD domain-containing protein [Bacillota bacterium]
MPVIYCLRNTQFIKYPFGIPELAASTLVIGLHLWRKNMYLLIVAGTFCYMFLLRMF